MAALGLWGGWSVGFFAGIAAGTTAIIAAFWQRARWHRALRHSSDGQRLEFGFSHCADSVFIAWVHAALAVVAVWAAFLARQLGFVGLTLIGLALYVRTELLALHRFGILRFRAAAFLVAGGYTAAGVGFIGVGLVPLTADLAWHNAFGITLVAAPLLLMFSSAWLFAGLPSRTILASYACAGGVAISVLLCRPLDIVNITTMEIVTFVVAFGWLCGILRAVANQLERSSPLGDVQRPSWSPSGQPRGLRTGC